MKIIKSLLVLLISMSFVSCSNDALSSSSSTHNSFNNQEIGEVYISFNNKRVEKNASINIETELIYGIDVRSKGFCPNIRLEYNKEYFETRDYFNFSEPNTGSYNRFFVKDKEGETSLKVYVNDVFQSEYHFIVSDNSIDYTLIDKTKNKYISPENIVKLTSLDEYKSYIESINYREKCTFTENYFKENNIYFVYTNHERNTEFEGLTKIYNDGNITYFNIRSQMGTMDEVNVDFYLEVYSLNKADVKEESKFFGSYYY